ncbi:hypothetical protein DFH06DRAFT_565779 [Mycena polygramma]|nr:hypothetical protein DFH06DRAFT_565779 [Mycena polygramma]
MAPTSDSPPCNERPTRGAWSSAPETPTADGRPNDEVIDVVIKTEGEPDQFRRVTLVKSEGNPDIWNVDAFGLGPTIEMDERYNRGFSKKVIHDAFGGESRMCRHHWKKRKPGKMHKKAFVTYHRSWNNALPAIPGAHGMVFSNLESFPAKPEPLIFFVEEGLNDWRLLGTYNYLRQGEIAPHHISLLPPHVLDNRVHSFLHHKADNLIERANRLLGDARKVVATRDGVLQALHDGRLYIPFTILQCVGYPKIWFEKLLYYEAHPKPEKDMTTKNNVGKRPLVEARGSSEKPKRAKLNNGKGKAKVSSDESDRGAHGDDSEYSDGSDSGDGSDSEYEEVHPRQVANLPRRTSSRISQQKSA